MFLYSESFHSVINASNSNALILKVQGSKFSSQQSKTAHVIINPPSPYL